MYCQTVIGHFESLMTGIMYMIQIILPTIAWLNFFLIFHPCHIARVLFTMRSEVSCNLKLTLTDFKKRFTFFQTKSNCILFGSLSVFVNVCCIIM